MFQKEVVDKNVSERSCRQKCLRKKLQTKMFQKEVVDKNVSERSCRQKCFRKKL
jgi:hypothetical protein